MKILITLFILGISIITGCAQKDPQGQSQGQSKEQPSKETVQAPPQALIDQPATQKISDTKPQEETVAVGSATLAPAPTEGFIYKEEDALKETAEEKEEKTEIVEDSLPSEQAQTEKAFQLLKAQLTTVTEVKNFENLKKPRRTTRYGQTLKNVIYVTSSNALLGFVCTEEGKLDNPLVMFDTDGDMTKETHLKILDEAEKNKAPIVYLDETLKRGTRIKWIELALLDVIQQQAVEENNKASGLYTEAPHTKTDIERFKKIQATPQETHTNNPHQDSKNRVAIDLAWMVGGAMVFGGSAYATARLETSFSKITPLIDRAARRRLQKSLAKTEVARLAEVEPGLTRAARKSLAKEIALEKSPRAIALRRGVPKIARWAARAGMFIGSAMAAWGTLELISDVLTSEAADGELQPQDRMEELKRSIYTFEKNPTETLLQDRVIHALMDVLPDAICSLKIQYNEEFLYVKELKSLTTVSSEEREKSEKEFQTFAQEVNQQIAFLEECSKTLHEVSSAEERLGQDKAALILQERVGKLEQILTQQALK